MRVHQNEEATLPTLPHTPRELFLKSSEWRTFFDVYRPEGSLIKDPNLNGIFADPGWKPYGPYIRIDSGTSAHAQFAESPEAPIIAAIQDALDGQVHLGNYRVSSLMRRENNSVSSVPALVNGDRVVAIIHGEQAYLTEHAPQLLSHLISERNLLASKPGIRTLEVDALVHLYHKRAILVAGFLGITRPEINFRICKDLGERDPAVWNQENLLGPLPLDWCLYRSGEETIFRRKAFAWSYNNHNSVSEGAGSNWQVEIDNREAQKLKEMILKDAPNHQVSVQYESDNFEHRYEGINYRAMVVICDTRDLEKVWLAIQGFGFQ